MRKSRSSAWSLAMSGSSVRSRTTWATSRPLARAWARRYLAFFFDLFFSSRYPVGPEGFSARARTACLRRILEKGGRRAYLKLTRSAGPLKTLAAPFVLLCGVHPLLDMPARLYFRLVYAPLVRWRSRRR